MNHVESLGSNPVKNSVQTADLPVIEEIVEKTHTLGERTIKAGQLALWNIGTAFLINLDLLKEDSWLRKEYQAVWNGRTIEVIKTSQSPSQQVEQSLVPKVSTDLATRSNIGALEENPKTKESSLVGKKFTIQLANGVKGELEILDLVTTLISSPNNFTTSHLPQLEHQSSSSALSRLWNGAGQAFNQVFGFRGQLSEATVQQSSTMRLTIDNIETIFKISFNVPAERLTPQFMNSVAGNIFGQIEGSSQPNFSVSKKISSPPQPLMLEGSRPVMKTSISKCSPSLFLTNQEAPKHLGIPPQVQNKRQPVVKTEERQQAPQRESERPKPKYTQTPPLVGFIMYWAMMHMRGANMGADRFTAKTPEKSQPWYSRFYSVFTKAIAYIGQSARTYSSKLWWQNATSIDTRIINVGNVPVKVDLLGIRLNDNRELD